MSTIPAQILQLLPVVENPTYDDMEEFFEELIDGVSVEEFNSILDGTIKCHGMSLWDLTDSNEEYRKQLEVYDFGDDPIIRLALKVAVYATTISIIAHSARTNTQ